MKLPSDNNYLEIGGNVSETVCTIGDENLILSYIRDKIYSNKPRVICQEIACNARDANIENGYPDVPIRIKTPTIFDPFWECSDNGPGMSPEAIQNVFSRFGISTKRNDEKSLGKFGIGSKSPLSYATSYTIRTCAWEGDYKVRREYHCALGENRSVVLVEFDDSAETTDDQTGTTVIIPIQSKDFNAFSEYSKDVTKFWRVPPIINGMEYKPQLPEYLYEYDDFCITKNPLGYSNGVILGEIFYPIDLGNLKFNNILTNKFQNRILLKFAGNELNVNIGRESLDYDEQTKSAIIERLNQALEIVQREAVEAVQSSQSLWDAHIAYGAHSDILGRRSIKWGNYEINSPNLTLPKDTTGRIYKNYDMKSEALNSWTTIKPSENILVVHKDTNVAPVQRCDELRKQYEYINWIYAIDNPTENLIEICAKFPKLSEVSYQRKKSSTHVWRVSTVYKYNRASWSHEDFIEKEKVLVNDADFSEYDCYIEYDNLYKVNRSLLKVVCADAKIIAVTGKSLKYVQEEELPTFEEYVKARALSIPDEIVYLREIQKHTKERYHTGSLNCPLMKLYGKILQRIKEGGLEKYPSDRYTIETQDERAMSAKKFIEGLNDKILTEYPLLDSFEMHRLPSRTFNQFVDFLQSIANSRKSNTFKELYEQYDNLFNCTKVQKAEVVLS